MDIMDIKGMPKPVHVLYWVIKPGKKKKICRRRGEDLVLIAFSGMGTVQDKEGGKRQVISAYHSAPRIDYRSSKNIEIEADKTQTIPLDVMVMQIFPE